ncbi:hypothetical protein [Pseudonocardia phyllosphaerae]|uniref:hypothetical protein n=1 Tax=Pseudonocardia phyllosphaerae TaxID=3390502 RepID=UPI0039791B19
MRTPAHPEPGGTDADVALAAMAREVDLLRGRLAGVEPLVGRVDELSRVVSQMADTLATLAARRRRGVAPSWLSAAADTGVTGPLLDELCAWLGTVFLRYPDGASVLPGCWLWHPDVVEELLWLMHAWCAAYQGPDASVGLAGDWHDRQRPGVVARVRRSAGSCSLEAHQNRAGWSAPPGAPPLVLGHAQVPLIAAWWADRRDQPPPEPPPGLIGGVLG